MGAYLKKSFKVGPVRLNLSKSGVGASVGVKGARIGKRPNGSQYVHVGRKGFYYRKELGKSTSNTKTTQTGSDSYFTEGLIIMAVIIGGIIVLGYLWAFVSAFMKM
jgi:hypothetical protein